MRDGGRSCSDPRVSAPRAFLLSRRDLPAPSSRAALQRRAQARYSGRGRRSGRGLRRPRGRKRRGGNRCVFVLVFCTLSLPSSPFSLRLLRLSHKCYSPHPPAPAAHTWLCPHTAVSVVPHLAAHVKSATAPSTHLPPTRCCSYHGRCHFSTLVPRCICLGCCPVAYSTLTSRPALQQSFGTSVCVCSLN